MPLAAIPDAALLVGAAGRCRAANSAALALLGTDPDALVGADLSALVAPWPLPAEDIWVPARLRRGDGSGLPVQARMAPLPTSGEHLVALFLRPLVDAVDAPADPSGTPWAVIATAPDGTITAWSETAEMLYGYRASEAIGQPEEILTPPEAAAEPARLRHQVLHGAAVAEHMTTRITKERQRLDVLLTMRPLRDAAGTIVGISSMSRNGVGPMMAEAALRASEARFRAAFADAPIGMALTAPDGRFLQVNRVLCDILGRSQTALLATSLPAVTHPADRDRDASHRAALLAGTTPTYQVEKRYPRPDGTFVWGRLSVSLVRDEGGAPRYVVAQLQDITPYKAAGAALRASEARFRAAFADAPNGMALITPDGRFVQVNRALADIIGCSEAELLATSLPSLTHPDDLALDRDETALLLSGDIATYQVEKRYVRGDGRVVWGEFSASLVRDEAGQPLHIVGQIQDITARKRAAADLWAAKEAAEEASRLKSGFLSTMSHELRTPLTAIMGYAELLLAGKLDPLAEADAAQVSRSAQHLLRLVDDLLDLSRIEAGRLDLAPEEVDPAVVLASAATAVTPLAAAKGLTLRVESPAGLPRLRADPDRLRQALLNLASNAVKFTEKGSVHLTARPAVTGGVELLVADTGVGIAAEALPHIFDAFRQADERTSRRYGGSGLGLAISRRLVEMHGGTLRVESTPGVGSTFTIWLPEPPAAASSAG